MDGRNVLHSPDQVAGGRADHFTGSGDAGVNKSLGGQWRSKVRSMDDEMEEVVDMVGPDLLPFVRMCVQLALS